MFKLHMDPIDFTVYQMMVKSAIYAAQRYNPVCVDHMQKDVLSALDMAMLEPGIATVIVTFRDGEIQSISQGNTAQEIDDFVAEQLEAQADVLFLSKYVRPCDNRSCMDMIYAPMEELRYHTANLKLGDPVILETIAYCRVSN